MGPRLTDSQQSATCNLQSAQKLRIKGKRCTSAGKKAGLPHLICETPDAVIRELWPSGDGC